MLRVPNLDHFRWILLSSILGGSAISSLLVRELTANNLNLTSISFPTGYVKTQSFIFSQFHFPALTAVSGILCFSLVILLIVSVASLRITASMVRLFRGG